MHQVHLGSVVDLINKATSSLRKFQDCVATALDMPGLAAKRLKDRFQLMLAKRWGRSGQR
jgi:hypothetical protein